MQLHARLGRLAAAAPAFPPTQWPRRAAGRSCLLSMAAVAPHEAAGGEQAAAAASGEQAAAGGEQVAHKKKVKRNVALHVGYVGSAYTGLQANRELPGLPTIEGVLERAILDAGLIAAVNFGDFRKTKWTRSSRTDKGVHSLCTVIGLRVLVDDDAYARDPEGIAYAAAINEHLPADVRVFAVQRTNKSFNARRWCGSRTYEYYLPGHVLGLDTPDGSSDADAARLALLRDALSHFVGYRAFHNYAGNRSQYVGQKAKAARRRERRAAKAAEAAASDDGAGTSSDTASDAADDGDVQQQQQQPAPPAAAADAPAPRPPPADSEDADSEVDAAEAQQYAAAALAAYSGQGPVPAELQWRQQARFLSEPDPDDPVVKSHYRMIRSFTADDPAPLVEGGVPCLRLEVCGDSFMLHQIRHMVGAAVAIVRGIMPRGLLDVSLSAPGRVTLPRAPPHTLLLSGSVFSPFPAGWGLETPIVAQYTGDRLRLREGGQQQLLEFRRQVFDAAINELLLHPDWEVWSRQMLPRMMYPADEVAPAVAEHGAWFAALKAKRAAEAAAKAEAAAAAAAEEEKQKEQADAAAAAAHAAAPPAEQQAEPAGRRGCVIM